MDRASSAVENWSVQETFDYLTAKGKTKLAQTLQSNELTAGDVMESDVADLVDVGIKKLHVKSLKRLFQNAAATPTPTPGARGDRAEGERPANATLISQLQQKLATARKSCQATQDRVGKCQKKVKTAKRVVDEPDSGDDSDDAADNQKRFAKTQKKLEVANLLLVSEKTKVADFEQQIRDAGGEVTTFTTTVKAKSRTPNKPPSPTEPPSFQRGDSNGGLIQEGEPGQTSGSDKATSDDEKEDEWQGRDGQDISSWEYNHGEQPREQPWGAQRRPQRRPQPRSGRDQSGRRQPRRAHPRPAKKLAVENVDEPLPEVKKVSLSMGRMLASAVDNLEKAPCDEKGIQCLYIPVRRIGPVDEKNKAILYQTNLDPAFGRNPFDKNIPEKVVLVVGATGAGKSTLINGLVNFMFGVQFSDDCRFKLIREDETVNKESFKLSKEQRQSMSQTDYTTIYRIGCYNQMDHRFRMTIIDTPGFGDTRGIARDQLIVENLAHVIDNRTKFGINHLNFISFVLPSNQGRLTPTMKYISQSILAMFGKDLHESILPCLTFSDGGKSNAINALQVDEVPFTEYCKFQNSAIYQKSKDDPFQAQMQGMYWKIGNANFAKMITLCGDKAGVTLDMTCDVAKQKRMIDANMYNVMNLMKVVGMKKNEMAKKQLQLAKHESDIAAGKKGMKIQVTFTKAEFKKCPANKWVTHCNTCHYTCHKFCSLDPDTSKEYCGAMGSGGKCNYCPKKCHFSEHRNYHQFVEYVQHTKTEDVKEMADKYAKGLKGKAKFDAIMRGLQKEINDAMDMQAVCVSKLRASRNRLEEIAMRPDPLSDTQYLDSLIKLEEMNKSKTGWEVRKQNLVELKQKVQKQNQIMRNVSQSTKGRAQAASSSWTMESIKRKIFSWMPTLG